MRTIDRLKKLSKQELRDAAMRLGLPPLSPRATAADWVQHVHRGLDTQGENLLLMLRREETEALKEALRDGLILRERAAFGGEMLMGLLTLEGVGLAGETEDGWELDERVPELLKLDEADVAQQHMQDIFYDYMLGWLYQVGIMPLDELTRRASLLAEPQNPEEAEDLAQLCYAVLVSRNGMDGLYFDETDQVWAVCEELQDPQALLTHQRRLAIRALPYPEFSEDMLMESGAFMQPGSQALYAPLEDELKRRGVKDGEMALATAVFLAENEQVDDAVEHLLESAPPANAEDANALLEMIFRLFNSIPRWYNKGYAPDSMPAQVKQGGKVRLPGRNDPCPCGSGRKYKLCCGRFLH